MKKILIILLVLFTIASIAFLSRGLLTNFQPSPVTLTYWGLWEDTDIINPIFADYQKSHPNIKIDYQKQSIIEYRERLQNALVKEEGPDLFRFHNTWLPMLKTVTAPLPPAVMSDAEFQKTFYPIAYKDLALQGKIYGIPLEIDTLGLFYNEDLLAKSGVQPPTTWDDLRKVAGQITVRDEEGRIQIAGVALGTTGNVEHWSDILGIMFLQNGTEMTKISSTIGSDGHNLGVDTLKYYTNFTTVDKVWDNTMDNSISAFASGKVAMIFAPSWEIFEIKRLNDLQPEKISFKVISIPQLPRKKMTWATYWVEGVSQKSQHQKEAWELLKYLSTKEALTKFYTLAANKRLFGEPFSRKDMAENVKNDPLVFPFVEQASDAASWYLSSRTYDNGLNDRIIKYFEDAINSANSGRDALEALITTEQGVTQVLTSFP